ncbi:MAG: hypothetical protein ABJA02_02400 [Acidobacteriota bacterium]
MKILFVIMMIVAAAAAVSAQDPAVAQLKKTELQKLDKMVGQWKGSGWIQQGPKRDTFTGTETVQSKVGGLATMVEGKFANPEGKVIHETLAVISYDEKLKVDRMSTYLASGLSGEYDFRVVGDAYEWGFDIPNAGTVRYTIKIDATTWHEIGEFSRDGGKTWFQTFEMKLERQK